MNPELPFAQPTEKGRGSTNLFSLFIGIGIVNVLLTVFAERLYGSWLAMGLTAAAAIAGSFFVELLTKARVEEQARKLEFVG